MDQTIVKLGNTVTTNSNWVNRVNVQIDHDGVIASSSDDVTAYKYYYKYTQLINKDVCNQVFDMYYNTECLNINPHLSNLKVRHTELCQCPNSWTSL